jgi:glycine/D-amino acid oxidase-like deaminating enzyme
MSNVPASARVVIIGGGVIGCSVAYHLTKLGWKDVVLLERKQLTSGTTWHAAGLIGQLRASSNMTKLAKYSAELYLGLEAETGVATGVRQVGSISVALTEERKEELFRSASMARAFGVPVEEISPDEVKKRYEHLNIDGVKAGLWLPTDGQGDPANIALALAKGARNRGAKVLERVKVTGVVKNGRRVTGVDWQSEDGDRGHITADMVVNCGGMWGHEVGRMAGVNVPLQACEHFYIVTEPIEGLTQMPVLRVPDECAYYKEDAGKYLLGAFEPISKSTSCPKISTILSRFWRMRVTACPCWRMRVFIRFSTDPRVLRPMMPIIWVWPLRWIIFGWQPALTRLAFNRQGGQGWCCRNGWTRVRNRLL